MATSKKKVSKKVESKKEESVEPKKQLSSAEMEAAKETLSQHSKITDEEKEQLRAEIKKEVSEEIRAEAKKKAFTEVCKQLGTTPEKLDALNKHRAQVKKDSEEIVEYEVPYICHINGRAYPKKGTASRGIAESLISMASKKRQRLLREKISTENEIYQLTGGQITSRVVKRTDETGAELSAK